MKSESKQPIITDEFLEWEERDAASISLFKHCIAGSAAGIMEHLALYPVDTIKVSILRFLIAIADSFTSQRVNQTLFLQDCSNLEGRGGSTEVLEGCQRGSLWLHPSPLGAILCVRDPERKISI